MKTLAEATPRKGRVRGGGPGEGASSAAIRVRSRRAPSAHLRLAEEEGIRKTPRMRWNAPAVSMLAMLIVACGGSEFSTADGVDAAIDGAAARDGARAGEGGEPLDTGIADGASEGGDMHDGDVSDSGEPPDAGGKRDAATDSGGTIDASSPDGGACSSTGQCDANHPCPTTGTGHVTCCASIIVQGPRCGFCSTGVCPG